MNKHIESIKKKLSSNDGDSEVWVGWLWENTDPRFIIPSIKSFLKRKTEGKVEMIDMGDRVSIKDDYDETIYYIVGFKVENYSDRIFIGDSDWEECKINPMWDNPAYAGSKEELINGYKL